MMVVITLSDCPPKVRGDLSKWLCEISAGVYVGNLSARVRQELWMRVCDNLKNGRATMVYSAQGEQQLNFEVHNSLWEPVDLDGIKLMRRPLPGNARSEKEPESGHTSRAGKLLDARRAQVARRRKQNEYVVIDIETSGLSQEKDRIIEIAALRVKDGEPVEEYQTLVNPGIEPERKITELTGITPEMLKRDGIPTREALEKLTAFVGNLPIVCHNVEFDCGFLINEAKRNGVKLFRNQSIDTLLLARRRVKGVKQYTLTTLCEHFGIDATGAHRALTDCHLTQKVLEKLNEI